MRIYVDELEEKMEFPPGVSLGEIIDQLCNQKIFQDRVISHVRVNGQELVEDENGLFPDVPGGEIDSLELQTELSREMAYQGVLDARNYLERLTPGIEKTAELFRLGEDAKSHGQYALCMEGINWFTQVLEGARQVMDLDYQKIVFNRVSVHSYIENLEHIISEMLTAQSDEDWVMLSDLLEYELLPIMEGWKEILPLIEKTARDQGRKAEGCETAKR
jgi:hypothetical protein